MFQMMNQSFVSAPEQYVQKLCSEVPLRLNLTGYCNLECFWCSRDGLWDVTKGSKLEAGLVPQFLRMMKQIGFQHEVLLSGGEPTLHPDFHYIANTIKDAALTSRITTNGTHLQPYFNDVFKEIRVSLHSTKAAIWQRITKKQESLFYQIIGNLTSGVYSFKGHSISTVVTPKINDTEDELRSLFSFCKQHGFGVRLLQLSPYGHEEDYPLPLDHLFFKSRNIDVELKISQLRWRNARKYNLNTFYDCDGLEINVQTNPCYDNVCNECNIWHFIQITPEWQLQPCMLDTRRIPLRRVIEEGDRKGLIEAIATSRDYSREHAKKKKRFSRWFDNSRTRIVHIDVTAARSPP